MTHGVLPGIIAIVNTKRKGSLAVGEAIAYFTKNENSVLIPVSDCDKYDLAIDRDGIIKRIQCKYSNDNEPSGAFIVDLRTFGGYREKTYYAKYLKDDFDLLFVYCSNGDKYLIPMEKILGKSHLALGVKSWNEYKC
ncbi:MAG: hypothetical protein CO135_00900 [Candidatus Levybacteria bacterium CG_4_9_14_3_um_filter_35_16]|nr:MAG: hypothetical protein COW87_03880 [Candidatus Levybacteria bacterium CG22_combo_CG10-13_8_21_14_all_35_11]PIY94271.1 MAG: hypothetical protein COY68_03335 [Candidatus Levybacteria bacterium CG_4_10_14_0_8_um_filter_35_23]PJA91515.1 MAG: hypothetical protein CO135_00900 [Candidatus Levybacteria bacterium CG_4_9_14_3_um_filter_35_16]PJC54083.1 MAG: hypothetical protein CO028_04265 [Candidatus Levybacteria bacterium CG_4_9_14_0_2_um_filter_35_21]